MTLATVVLLAAVIVFAVDAWLSKSLIAVGLTLFALYFLLGAVRL